MVVVNVDVVGVLASEVSPEVVCLSVWSGVVLWCVPVKEVQGDPTPKLRYDNQKRPRLVRSAEEDALVHCCCTSAASR